MPEQINPFANDEQTSLGTPLNDSDNQKAWIAFGLLAAALTWGYWNMLTYTASFWDNPLYSHGYIIPLICGFLFWSRSGAEFNLSAKEKTIVGLSFTLLFGIPLRLYMKGLSVPSWMVAISVGGGSAIFLFYVSRAKLTTISNSERWIGVGIVIFFLLMRLAASTYDINPLDRLSYVGALLGITQIVGGTRMLKWAGPPLAFLVFMFPLPKVLEDGVLLKLQRAAAHSSTWTLQLLGIPALREGSRITIDELQLDVADACSGLRMSTIFGAMSVALAMMMNRPWWDRLAILISAIPVALVTNVIRITVTALIFMATDSDAVHSAVHDWAGLAMMPVAMGILWLELQILHKITVPIDTEDYAAFGAAHG